MDNQEEKKSKKQRKITLIEILIVVVLCVILGKFIYLLFNWHDTYEEIKRVGALGTVAIIIAVVCFSKFIKKL